MTAVRLVHTADLSTAELGAVRALLLDAFDGDFSDADWEHALGGLHALVRSGGELVGHGSVVQRRLLHGGRALRAGYVEGVGVRADRRGRGLGAALMDPLERVIRAAYDLGALSASAAATGFYATRGWLRWPGPTAVLAPEGIRRTPEEDGGVYVLPGVARLDPRGELACDWRPGDVW
jgi:aminoglycoside 2'-N-acetyltransferase I